ncbi:SAP domain-containing protein [Hirschfeldia incana]|nr:SAP domain-containing protein [Hirschfeldia incana]
MTKEKEIIDLCSSEEEEDDFTDEENDCIPVELNETEEEESSLGEEDSDWSHDDDATDSEMEFVDREDETGEKGDDADDDDDKVTRLLTAGSDLKKYLNAEECKTYLRKHGLRLSGTKAVFIERILQHCRIKDGSGQALYPKSSFAINCKGDVCKGDTVLFTQKVHHKYEKMKRSGKIMGRRTVAGQVVKESYGSSKQQHTFTIEVLWCEGIQKLPPLYPLLVKGRNLYRLMTLRQRWANEEDRVKALSEKHGRGAAARKVMRERKIKSGYVLKDGRLQKPVHVKKTRKNDKDVNQTHSFRHDNPTQLNNMNPSFHSHTHAPRPNIPPSHSYASSSQPNQSIQRPALDFYNRPTFNALQGHANTLPMPVTPHRRRAYENYHDLHASSNSGYNYGVRELDHFSDTMVNHRREGGIYRQGEDTRRPYKNHQSYHSNSSSGYNHGARHMTSHRREGDAHRDTY